MHTASAPHVISTTASASSDSPQHDACDEHPSTTDTLYPIAPSNTRVHSLHTIMSSIESADLNKLKSFASQHGLLQTAPKLTRELIRSLLVRHVSEGYCSQSPDQPGCAQVVQDMDVGAEEDVWDNTPSSQFRISLLKANLRSTRLRPLRRILKVIGTPFDAQDSLRSVRKSLRQNISQLKKAKRSPESIRSQSAANLEKKKADLRQSWPQLVPDEVKRQLSESFTLATSNGALSTFACGVCAESTYARHTRDLLVSELDLSMLRAGPSWFDPLYPKSHFPSTLGPWPTCSLDQHCI